ncbi:hypothetical protein AAZX31_20G083900 [Glycine max]|uniref:Uncharacterized protein n=2 Tax=Glycine subgen. Soja TaxID=1462606 RepID=I1NEW2_SOYBN|nr:protein NIM1-INTERACTING 3 [Glycine max]XP_028220406.1 protein NIM1-INTERACTING 3-like [Glycine soja]KAG4909926.1 hypothetical protein JHK87_056042 [Glycine soja]KAG4918507.1 hypothetical protein JHK85_056788 [Glycine max]KAG5074585.1 hypothetical protein JHK84_055816 [Glycine max]KAH1035322.1 hypothetical protein GYH30_055342 [Glycine max]KAH1190354.1 hypothetical protein GmHk_20G057921 [Glycine max]|eukprot:XP_003555787.1 protein NIM1-INTERACTING 3 [Glycine max]
MEGERRKRRMEREEESEEQQMEKFFALIKSTKDVRDRLSKQKEEEKAKGGWKPTFQPEDFMDHKDLAKINVLRHQPAAPSSGSGKEVTPEPHPEAQHGNNNKPTDLDLTLSL